MKDELCISLDAVMRAIQEKLTASFDLVVGVERGGILPAYLAARWLNRPLKTMAIRFRDDSHQPLHSHPTLEKGVDVPVSGLKILLVDDVSNTGATLRLAASLLKDAVVTTMVISGQADISLFGPHDRCIRWPWDRAMRKDEIED